MNIFPDKEIQELNDLLWKTLGPEGEDIFRVKEKESLELLHNLDKKVYLKLYKILNFYYPRLVASRVIDGLNDYRYNEFASDNEVIIGLTSIIDWLNTERINEKRVLKRILDHFNPNKEKGYTQKFAEFLDKYLDKTEVESLLENNFIKDKKGKTKKLKSIKDLAKYIYKIRSLVVHNAELGGMWPYNVSFDISPSNMQISNVCYIIEPRIFRRLLWKAIAKSIGIDLVSNS